MRRKSGGLQHANPERRSRDPEVITASFAARNGALELTGHLPRGQVRTSCLQL